MESITNTINAWVWSPPLIQCSVGQVSSAIRMMIGIGTPSSQSRIARMETP